MFSRIMAQGIFPSPIQPSGASGILRFDVGIGGTGVAIDKNASWWINSVGNDISVSNYVGVPRLIVSKGLSVVTITGSYAQVYGSDGKIIGGTLDVPIINGGLVEPTLAIRGSYATLTGIDEYKLNTYGLELFLGKGFGPVTPYGAIGKQRGDATGTIPSISKTLRDESTITRYTVGAAFNVLLLRINVEVNQAEERSYGAKIGLGF